MDTHAREGVERASRDYSPAFTRTIAAPSLIERGDDFDEKVMRWVLPWTIKQYPGLRRGLVQLLNNGWTWSAIRGWRSGRRRMPVLAAQRFRDYIAGRCEVGLSLVAELDKYIAEYERKPGGWQVVKDRDGDGSTRDGRNRVGKRKNLLLP